MASPKCGGSRHSSVFGIAFYIDAICARCVCVRAHATLCETNRICIRIYIINNHKPAMLIYRAVMASCVRCDAYAASVNVIKLGKIKLKT